VGEPWGSPTLGPLLYPLSYGGAPVTIAPRPKGRAHRLSIPSSIAGMPHNLRLYRPAKRRGATERSTT
jgi:hypothetical protein